MAWAAQAADIPTHFGNLTDPRRRAPKYPLLNIVFMSLCAVICETDDFVAIAKWARIRRDWLSQFLDLSAGVPSQNRFNAVLRALRPGDLEKCLLNWICHCRKSPTDRLSPMTVSKSARRPMREEQVADAVEQRRRSDDKACIKSAIHRVSAWAPANHVSLDQAVLDEKSNEITVVPKLLELVEVSGALLTIDAMGRQTEASRTIVEEGADDCLRAKQNQPTLYDQIVAHLTN